MGHPREKKACLRRLTDGLSRPSAGGWHMASLIKSLQVSHKVEI